MRIRHIASVLAIVLIGGLVVACGRDEEKPAEAAPTAVVTITPVSSPARTPTTEVVKSGDVAVKVTATSVIATTPVASPIATIPAGTPVALSADNADEMALITGTLTLDGRAQQDYIIDTDGCVGLGEWRSLKPGTQVVVRNADGTVVDIAVLEANTIDDECSWSFSINAPADEFFGVSIPMMLETWFAPDDPGVQAGEIELTLP